ncbi:MAG TPA: amino acid racemase [Candidatus Aminicenantes bacterium]|nr:amino acid racemase [Candidatus Aminicenantes bacterium]
MKTIGMIGGTGWVSSVDYYREVNRAAARLRGGDFTAPCILWSLDFGELAARKEAGDQEQVYALFRDAALGLEAAGCGLLMLCANTPHLYANRLEKKLSVPLVHIARATAAEIRHRGMRRVGLLGTRITMEGVFYHEKLADAGIEALVPPAQDRELIDHTIFNELMREDFRPERRQRFLEIMDGLVTRGAEGIVLGCTEIPLLVRPEHTGHVLFNTLEIHARAAVSAALEIG